MQIDANRCYNAYMNTIRKTNMATQPNRLTVALDDDTIELLKRLEKFTGLSPAQTVAKLMPAHLEDLWNYLGWLESLPEGPSKRRSLGVNLMQSFGPRSLTEDIKRIDPAYQTEGEKFAEAETQPWSNRDGNNVLHPVANDNG